MLLVRMARCLTSLHCLLRAGYTAETDASGKEKWPIGDEKAWKEGIPHLTTGECSLCAIPHPRRRRRRESRHSCVCAAFQAFRSLVQSLACTVMRRFDICASSSSILALTSGPSEVPEITKSVVNHVHTSLARQAYNLDNIGAYQASALSVRDNLLVSHDTSRSITSPDIHTLTGR